MLTQRSPSAISTKILCIACGGQMPLTLVEPAYDGKQVDNHTFRCAACGLIETYVFDRGHSYRVADHLSGRAHGQKTRRRRTDKR